MSKAEKFIQENIKDCSNELSEIKNTIVGKMKVVNGHHPWLTPDQARKAVEIAREETIKEVCEWLDNHTMLSEKWFIEDLKKHLEGKV